MHKSGRGIGVGGGLKGLLKRNSRKKTAVKVSESEEWVDVPGSMEHSPARELPRRMSLKRKNSFASDKVSSYSTKREAWSLNISSLIPRLHLPNDKRYISLERWLYMRTGNKAKIFLP